MARDTRAAHLVSSERSDAIAWPLAPHSASFSAPCGVRAGKRSVIGCRPSLGACNRNDGDGPCDCSVGPSLFLYVDGVTDDVFHELGATRETCACCLIPCSQHDASRDANHLYMRCINAWRTSGDAVRHCVRGHERADMVQQWR